MSTEPQVSYGYQIEQENFGGILAYGLEYYHQFKASFDEYQWEPPKEIDPREWFNIENQQNSSSCEGQSRSSAGEYLTMLSDGEEIQLSRYFAYLAAQEMGGGMRGDNGAYLEAGTRASARGIPLESRFPWSTNYSAQRSKYRAELSDILAGPVYKYGGAVPLGSSEDCYRFLSSFAGVIQIGIGWSLSNTWEHKSYRSGGGGHAVLICGYLSMPSWPMGIGFLLMNSWGTSWGRDGWGLIHPNAIDQMIRSRGTFIGRSDLISPRPRVEAIDNFRARYKQGSGRTIGGTAL